MTSGCCDILRPAHVNNVEAGTVHAGLAALFSLFRETHRRLKLGGPRS